MTPDCQSFEELLSAHLDGEASPEAAVAALEHALRCPDCRAFYHGSRRLERELAGADSGAGSSAAELPPPERLWQELRRRSGWTGEEAVGSGGFTRRRVAQRWVFAAAAVLAAAVGLSLWVALDEVGSGSGATATRALRESAGSSTETVEPAAFSAEQMTAGRMTDERFVAITRELLGADPRYLRAMEGVLREVAPASEGGGGEDLPVRGERVGLIPLRGPV